MAIALFPLYEGESIGSNIGRYAYSMGLNSTRNLRERLFGYECKPGTRLPCAVSHLAEQTRDYWNLKAQEIIDNHTEFRYATMMASSEMRDELLRKILEPSTGLDNRLNMCSLRGEQMSRLRYCEQCLAEWRDARRQPFWKMDHQLPGVYICTVHSTTLKFVKKLVPEFEMDTPVSVLHQACDEFVLQRSTPLERVAIADIASRSIQQRASNCGSKSLLTYEELWRNAGFVRRGVRISLMPLVREWLAYFGDEYCHLTSMNEQKIYWWANWVTGRVARSEFPHPFMFLAAESFFERRVEAPGSFVPASEKREESNGVAGAPLCRGEDDFSQLGHPVCSAAMHRESDSFKIFRTSTKSGNWKAVCSCGVTYVLKKSSEAESLQMMPFKFGLRYRQRCQALLEKGVRMSEVARELGLSTATVLHWKRRVADDVKLPAEELLRLRSEWRELVKSAPSSNRLSSATRMGSATRSKLERFDREWLLEFNRKNRSPLRGGKADVERGNRRSELFRQTQKRIRTACDMLKQVEPPVHVTRAAIARKAGLPQSLFLGSTPYSELLAELTESRSVYIERVIIWMAALSGRQPLRSIDDACALAGLYRTSFTKEQRARIYSLLSKDCRSS